MDSLTFRRWLEADRVLTLARHHADGDHASGRLWSCWCAGCRMARAAIVRRAAARVDAEVRMRCPHDGGACHHACESACHRKAGGMSLTTPWDGFPRRGRLPVIDDRNPAPPSATKDGA